MQCRVAPAHCNQRKPAQSNEDLVQPGKKEWKTKQRTRTTNRKQLQILVNINALISTITLSVNCLNIPIKKQKLSDWKKIQNTTIFCLHKATLKRGVK